MRSLKTIFKYFSIFVDSILTSIDERSIFFVPHFNCIKDKYDIINYKSDNVLCLFNSILRDPQFVMYKLYIVYFDSTKLGEYKEYCKEFDLSRITFVYQYDLKLFSSCFSKCKYVFTDEIYNNYKLKKKEQKIICLNYYPFPYKSDYVKLFDEQKKKYLYPKEQARINRYYDYLVSTSDLSSIAISQAEPFYYEKCVTLGFPRTGIFYKDNASLRERVISLFPFEVNKIFVYVPTHRDYENKSRQLYDKNSRKRTIWGYEPKENIEKLEQFLHDEKTIIIAKIHPVQAREILDVQKSDRILTYHDVVSKLTISLNELMAISDAMITDYTSAVFDYLMSDKPIIYYHFDIEKYNNTRGFFINPMTPLCAGDTCYNLLELTDSLKEIIEGKDNYREKRKFILDLLITYQDANAEERIKKYFFG